MKTAFVTGGARGIGAAAVRALAREGYRVAFVYRASREAARALSGETGALAIQADVSGSAQVGAAVDQAIQAMGHIDLLINNAGVAQTRLFPDITDEDWRRMIDVNLSGAFYAARAVLPGMIARKRGAIINLSSVWGLAGGSCEVHYSAAKAGLIGLTKALAKEVGPSGITVNCVAPGVIRTDMNADLSEGDCCALIDQTPLGRLGTAEEIAELLVYLASDKASFITGQVISPNGGFVI